MPEFIVQTDKSTLDPDKILSLYNAVGWNKNNTRTIQNITKGLLISEHIAYINVDGLLVAFGRLYSSGFNAVIQDIMTHPNFRRLGMAKLILKNLQNYSAQHYPYARLVDGGDMDDFYNKMGFKGPKYEKTYYWTSE